jgi:hypothetical protein
LLYFSMLLPNTNIHHSFSDAAAASDKAGVNPKFSLKFFENVVDRFPTKAPSLPSSPSLGGLQDADTRPAFAAKNEATPVRVRRPQLLFWIPTNVFNPVVL